VICRMAEKSTSGKKFPDRIAGNLELFRYSSRNEGCKKFIGHRPSYTDGRHWEVIFFLSAIPWSNQFDMSNIFDQSGKVVVCLATPFC